MKHKLSGPLILSIGIAALAAMGEWIVLMLMSLASWAMVYIILLIINIPIVYWLVNIYHRTNCYSVDELWYEVIDGFTEEEDEEENKPRSLDD